MYENVKITDLNEYVRIFNELLEKVAEKFQNFFEKTNSRKASDEEFELKYEIIVNEILETCEEICENLKAFHICEREYYDFIAIESIIRSVLTEKKRFNEKNLEIVSNILKKYREITEFKFEIIQRSINEGNKSLNNLPIELKEEFKMEYVKFERKFLYDKLEYYSQDEDYDISTQAYFDEFEDILMR